MKKGWEVKKLGEVLKLEYGKPLDRKDRSPDGQYPVYGANGVKDWSDRYFHDKPTIVVGRKGSAGEVNLTENHFWPLDVTFFATFDHRIYDLHFLYHLLQRLNLTKLAKGVKPGINRNDVYSLPVFIPPLPEQRRIVGVLDEAFAAIATAKANTEKNLQNAHALFESHLQSVFTQRGDGWVEKRLDKLCTFSSGGTPSKSNSSYWQGKIPWVSGRDMKSTRLSDSTLHISHAAVDQSSTRMASAGTLLILVRGMGLAHGAQIAELLVPCAFNQDIRGLHVHPGLLPRYLLFALRDGINSSDTVLSNAAHGTLKIDSNELQKMMIPFPPPEQQRRIITVIDTLTAETHHLATLYTQKLSSLDALKQSLLHQAFCGEL